MSLSKDVNGEDTGSGDSPERTRKDKAYSQLLCLVSFRFLFIHTTVSTWLISDYGEGHSNSISGVIVWKCQK